MNEEQEKEVTPEKEEGKPFEIFKEAEYHKPPDEDDNPPPPMPRSDQEPDEESNED